MWNDKEIMLCNFYKMPPPDAKYMKERMKKVAAVIEKMGNTYCLAIPVERKT